MVETDHIRRSLQVHNGLNGFSMRCDSITHFSRSSDNIVRIQVHNTALGCDCQMLSCRCCQVRGNGSILIGEFFNTFSRSKVPSIQKENGEQVKSSYHLGGTYTDGKTTSLTHRYTSPSLPLASKYCPLGVKVTARTLPFNFKFASHCLDWTSTNIT